MIDSPQSKFLARSLSRFIYNDYRSSNLQSLISGLDTPSKIIRAIRPPSITIYQSPLTKMLPDLRLNDHLRLRKQHPCGSYEWTVTRLGADIGLECKGCGRRVMLTRRELAKRVKTNLTKHNEEQDEP